MSPLVPPAAAVLRQNRSLPSAAGTVMSDVPELTTNTCPVSAFCGVDRRAQSMKRESRQEPVQVTGSLNASKCVSL